MNEQTSFVIDKLCNNNSIKTVLNIGFRSNSDRALKSALENRGKVFSVLEAFKQNCIEMQKDGSFSEVICADVRNIGNVLGHKYDAIIWLHGPEHLVWEEFLAVRKDIEDKANRLVIYQAPIGPYPQDDLYGNTYEIHKAVLRAEMFEELGYKTKNHNKGGEFTLSAWLEK